ncbi:MAG: efflux RND transporter permease subunit, partial [Myxococcota bacterium]|nr:efflux RND transporter permease subunit [Myxococcota bacterium]
TGARLRLLSDQSRFIERAIEEVQSAAINGGLLAILILGLFLGSGWQTLIIGVSIPLSIITCFIPLHFADVSLNLMSLGGLALGVGMLVDNAIVVLENIARHREAGLSPLQAAERGAREVSGAVTAATLTTVAVFAPVIGLEGVAGQLFQDLALTVVAALLASLVVALCVVPMLSARGGSDHRSDPQEVRRPPWVSLTAPLSEWHTLSRGLRGWIRRLLELPWLLLELILRLFANLTLLSAALFTALLALPMKGIRATLRWLSVPAVRLTRNSLSWLTPRYLRLLHSCLQRPGRILFIGALICAGTLSLLPQLKLSLLPELAQGELLVSLRYPIGTSLEDCSTRSLRLVDSLRRWPEIRRAELFAGEPEEGSTQNLSGERVGPERARISLLLNRLEDELAVARRLQGLASFEPGLQIELRRPSLFQLQPPLLLVLRGPRLDRLKEAEAQLRPLLEGLEGVREVESSQLPGRPELQLHHDPERLVQLGMSPRSLAERVRARLYGVEALTLRWEGEALPVRVRLDPRLFQVPKRVESLRVTDDQGISLPLQGLASLHRGEGAAELRHVGGERAIELALEVDPLSLATAREALRSELARAQLPPSVSWQIAGQAVRLEESQRGLQLALLLALFLVYVVMATQFESLRAPLLIMGSVPLAALGVIITLVFTKTPLSVVAFVGLITLIGIVVNNAIVFVDAAWRHQRAGTERVEALLEAGRERLRPILMTTLTTLLGLAPMLITGGEGAELRMPLALTLMSGLASSTLLTLFLIPSAYLFIMPRRSKAEGSSAA